MKQTLLFMALISALSTVHFTYAGDLLSQAEMVRILLKCKSAIQQSTDGEHTTIVRHNAAINDLASYFNVSPLVVAALIGTKEATTWIKGHLDSDPSKDSPAKKKQLFEARQYMYKNLPADSNRRRDGLIILTTIENKF